MKRPIVALFILFWTQFICPLAARAQYNIPQNKVWAFGYYVGLDFNSSPPVVFSTSIHASEGTASVSDATGHLLFYTDGETIWNRVGDTMPTGSSFLPYITRSTSQAAVIAPVIGNTSQYYVFSLEEKGIHGRLSYSIVDMNLAGGMGDLVPSNRGIFVDSLFDEKMITIPHDTCHIWLLLHRKKTNQFWAYDISPAGINLTPVVSTVGVCTDYDNYGVIKISPNRRKLISMNCTSCDHYTPTADNTELFDFNPATGIVSNCRVLNNRLGPYGAEFSPDNTKLYARYYLSNVFQYDLSLPTTAAIIASEYTVSPDKHWGDMKLGPDNKIYIAMGGEPYLNCIAAPNSSGTGCNYVDSAINLSPGMCVGGLPNVFWSGVNCFAGVNEKEAGRELVVWPNPASNILRLKYLAEHEQYDIQVFDLFGSVKKHFKAWADTNEITFDVSNLPTGDYTIKIISNSSVFLKKVQVVATTH